VLPTPQSLEGSSADFDAAGPSRVRPNVVIVESVDGIRATSLRVGKAFARAGLADILVCHWHTLKLTPNSVKVCGPAYILASNGSMMSVPAQEPITADSLFFFSPHCGLTKDSDLATLRLLAEMGIIIEKAPLHRIVDQVMLEASRRSVVTNALGPDRDWSPKDHQELRLRDYEKATGKTIPRPCGFLAGPSRLAYVLDFFASRGLPCIVKPVRGDGGRGIKIVRPGASPAWAQDIGKVIVQELMPDPLLVNGHKADLRCYLLIDADNRKASGRIGPILVRRAAAPYRPGIDAAEITNTAVRQRQGLPADVSLLDQVGGVDDKLRDAIITQSDLIARELAEAYFWNVPRSTSSRCPAENRVLLFGLDVLVTMPAGQPLLSFLEINPFPALFRGSAPCDSAVDAMLALAYLPALLRPR
jgi:Tubulin-tyrosine ligase family